MYHTWQSHLTSKKWEQTKLIKLLHICIGKNNSRTSFVYWWTTIKSNSWKPSLARFLSFIKFSNIRGKLLEICNPINSLIDFSKILMAYRWHTYDMLMVYTDLRQGEKKQGGGVQGAGGKGIVQGDSTHSTVTSRLWSGRLRPVFPSDPQHLLGVISPHSPPPASSPPAKSLLFNSHHSGYGKYGASETKF